MNSTTGSKEIIAQSESMRHVRDIITQIAPTDVTVLITGESGTGKELVARTIHQESQRRAKSLVAVNCAALPETILESELFGHEKGAFTDAREQRKGRFELAFGGTLFLDEIGDMTPATQVKLLRVLEESEMMRLGGSKPIKIDVRIIAATNQDLELAVAHGRFRKDLYYRLKVITLKLPPLRERREDIPLLIDTFIKEFCRKNNLDFPGFTDEVIDILVNYSWPGNVRELQNLIKNLIILSPRRKVDRQTIPRYLVEEEPVDNRRLPVPLHKTPEQAERELIYRAVLEVKQDLADLKKLVASAPAGPEAAGQTLDSMEREMIRGALEEFRYNKKKAARKLGIGERTIYRKIRKYGLE